MADEDAFQLLTDVNNSEAYKVCRINMFGHVNAGISFPRQPGNLRAWACRNDWYKYIVGQSVSLYSRQRCKSRKVLNPKSIYVS